MIARCAALLLAAAIAPAAPASAQPERTQPRPDTRALPAPAALDSLDRAEDERDATDGWIVAGLADTRPAVRARAARAAGRLQDSTLVDAVVPLTTDADPAVRREAIFALGQIGHRSAHPALERSLGSGDVTEADLALEALGKLGDKGATTHVVPYLGNASPLLRGEAAVALWRLADSTALAPLIARADDPDPDVRWRVLYALEKINAPDRIVLVAALHVDDPAWLVRAYAVRTMGRQKSLRATAYLLPALDDREVGVAVNAMRALQQVADSTCGTCLARLTHVLKDGVHPYLRVTAASVLADRFAWQQAPPEARTAALGALADAVHRDLDPATRGAAARALLAQRGVDALPDVHPLLADSSIYTRVAVLQALTLLPADAAVPLLLERLDGRTPLFERTTAAEALGTLKVRAALPRLRAGLDDRATLYVASVAGALADLGDSASVPALERAWRRHARDADADARIAIRDALRQLAGRARADSLERRDPPRNAGVRYDAAWFAPPAWRGAILHTNVGDITWQFDSAEAPHTVQNFCRLAERGYFDGLALHRVVPNFVVQDGDPTGTGSGGPGYTIRCEYNPLRYDAGMVGMALSGKDTGGSQWFITHSPQHHLDGRYTIFAHVTNGMDVVHRLVQGDRIRKVDLVK
ncbi:MAG TPA: HEAT repeat domain-containing protein [Candidatus Eisenbacteria bacterium]|nr:HEAT repeat domain-containing protein [Candidatus Eisenbacteria bacterium]